VAESADDRSRQVKSARAQDLLLDAIREAREAGLRDADITRLFRQALSRGAATYVRTGH
jgi:DNA-binding transcriptional regulator YhcF (GntR family)